MNPLRVLSLFAGIGGFDLGLERTGGFETVAFCEINKYCQRVLAKHWPKVPCYDDVCSLTADRLAADGIAVDAICGGFPCQDVSVAGLRKGLGETRSGLWEEYRRIISEIRPRYVIVENVAGLLTGPDEAPGAWFATILSDLATLRYDAEWHGISASAVGAAHVRDRVWIIAYPERAGWQGLVANGSAFECPPTPFAIHSNADADEWRSVVASQCGLRNGDGLPVSVERRRIGAIGNAVVPQIPEMIGRAILQSISNNKDT